MRGKREALVDFVNKAEFDRLYRASTSRAPSLMQEDGPAVESNRTVTPQGNSHYASFMSPATRDKVLESRVQEIEAFAISRKISPASVYEVAKETMQTGKVPDLGKFGLTGDDAVATKHFMVSEILQIQGAEDTEINGRQISEKVDPSEYIPSREGEGRRHAKRLSKESGFPGGIKSHIMSGVHLKSFPQRIGDGSWHTVHYNESGESGGHVGYHSHGKDEPSPEAVRRAHNEVLSHYRSAGERGFKGAGQNHNWTMHGAPGFEFKDTAEQADGSQVDESVRSVRRGEQPWTKGKPPHRSGQPVGAPSHRDAEDKPWSKPAGRGLDQAGDIGGTWGGAKKSRMKALRAQGKREIADQTSKLADSIADFANLAEGSRGFERTARVLASHYKRTAKEAEAHAASQGRPLHDFERYSRAENDPKWEAARMARAHAVAKTGAKKTGKPHAVSHGIGERHLSTGAPSTQSMHNIRVATYAPQGKVLPHNKERERARLERDREDARRAWDVKYGVSDAVETDLQRLVAEWGPSLPNTTLPLGPGPNAPAEHQKTTAQPMLPKAVMEKLKTIAKNVDLDGLSRYQLFQIARENGLLGTEESIQEDDFIPMASRFGGEFKGYSGKMGKYEFPSEKNAIDFAGAFSSHSPHTPKIKGKVVMVPEEGNAPSPVKAEKTKDKNEAADDEKAILGIEPGDPRNETWPKISPELQRLLHIPTNTKSFGSPAVKVEQFEQTPAMTRPAAVPVNKPKSAEEIMGKKYMKASANQDVVDEGRVPHCPGCGGYRDDSVGARGGSRGGYCPNCRPTQTLASKTARAMEKPKVVGGNKSDAERDAEREMERVIKNRLAGIDDDVNSGANMAEGSTKAGGYPFVEKEKHYKGHTDAQLDFAHKDALKAAEAVKDHDPTAHGWYMDDAATIHKEIRARSQPKPKLKRESIEMDLESQRFLSPSIGFRQPKKPVVEATTSANAGPSVGGLFGQNGKGILRDAKTLADFVKKQTLKA